MTLFFALSELGLNFSDIAEMHRSFVDAIQRANQDLLDSWWRP